MSDGWGLEAQGNMGGILELAFETVCTGRGEGGEGRCPPAVPAEACCGADKWT